MKQPPPVRPEACSVPPDDGLRLDDEKDIGPATPEASQGDPEDTVGGTEAGPLLPRHSCELLPKGKVLEQQLAARTERGAERREQCREEAKHGAGKIVAAKEFVKESRCIGILATNRWRLHS